MTNIAGSVLLLGLLLLSACFSEQGKGDTVATESGAADVWLTPEQIDSNKKLALAGDIPAAFRLARHFSVAEGGLQEARVWWQVAAENGDLDAMINLAKSLDNAGGKDNCARSVNWIRRAERTAQNSADPRLHQIQAYRRAYEEKLKSFESGPP